MLQQIHSRRRAWCYVYLPCCLARPYHISNPLKKALSPCVTSVVMAQVLLESTTFYLYGFYNTAPCNFWLKPFNDRMITDVIIGFNSSARVGSLHTVGFYRSPLELESRCLRSAFGPDFFEVNIWSIQCVSNRETHWGSKFYCKCFIP